MSEETLADIEAREIEEANARKLVPDMDDVEIVKAWAKLSIATDEEVAELTKLQRQYDKAARNAMWQNMGGQ